MNGKNAKKNKPFFLATTALEEFWDTTKPILFLGDWCPRYSRRSFWEPLKGQLLPNPWSDKRDFYTACYYVNDVYNRLLLILSETLNSIHRVKYSERYWRIVLGPWLSYYVDALYDRYVHIRKALDEYPDFVTIGLSDESFVIPRDSMDSILLMLDDPYSLQVYTRIITALGKDCPKQKYKIDINRNVNNQAESLKRRFKKSIKKALSLIERMSQASGSIVLMHSCFSPFVERKIVLKNMDAVCRCTGTEVKPALFLFNLQIRAELQNLSFGKGEFESLLIKMLPLDIPSCFIEGFEDIKNKAFHNYPRKPKAIVSANDWYFNEAFKQWAGFSAENGAKLLGVQHGGNYGSLLFVPWEEHELAITDRFYSNGWTRSDYAEKIIAFPSAKLTGRKTLGANNQNNDVLFTTTGFPRYLYRFQHLNGFEFDDNFSWQLQLVGFLNPEIRAKIHIRQYISDYGRDITQRWKDKYPEVVLEKWDIPFWERLKKCRLFICDHLATTFSEALAANKPTILFWSPKIWELRREAQAYYDELRSVGILHDTPESAALAVNSIYNDVGKWWNDLKRQNIRRKFCDRFARTSPNAINEWANEFKQIAKSF